MTAIDTILFDFDGTLGDTNRLIAESYLYVFDKYFPGQYDLNSVRKFNGPPLYDVFAEVYPEDPQKLVDEYRAFNQEKHDELIRPFPHVTEALDELKHHRLQLAVVSTKKRSVLNRGLSALNLTGYFDVILGGDEYQHAKPAPDGLDTAVTLLGAEKEQSIMVGDNWHDIEAANQAKMRGVFVEWSEKPLTEILPYKPYKTVKSMLELTSWVLSS